MFEIILNCIFNCKELTLTSCEVTNIKVEIRSLKETTKPKLKEVNDLLTNADRLVESGARIVTQFSRTAYDL